MEPRDGVVRRPSRGAETPDHGEDRVWTGLQFPVVREPSTLTLEELRARLEELAAGEPGGQEPSLERVLAEMRRRFPEETIDAALFQRLLARGGKVEGAANMLTEEAALHLLREVALAMGDGSPTPYDGLQYSLAGAYARRGEAAGRLAEELASAADPRPRVSAAILAQARPPRVDLLLLLAADPDAEVRVTALEMMEALLNDGVVPGSPFEEAAFAALSDPEARVRGEAMDLLEYLGDRGGAEAARILRAGEHRACEAGPEGLVLAALRTCPRVLLDDPWAEHLAEDLGLGAGGLGEGTPPGLLGLLVPQARRILAGLPEGTQAHITFLRALVEAGEIATLRTVLQDPGLPWWVQAVAAEEFVDGCPPREWEAPVGGWMLRCADPMGPRVAIERAAKSWPRPGEPSGARADAWERILGTLVERAEDAALRADARKALEGLR